MPPRPRTLEEVRKDFWNRVDKPSQDPWVCWVWQGPPRKRDGYGELTVWGKKYTTYKFAFFLVHGYLPKGKNVCHTCDNRLCVRPEHLWVGSQKENLHDMQAKGRKNQRKGPELFCRKKGHPLTPENRSPQGCCKICRRERHRRDYANKKVRD